MRNLIGFILLIGALALGLVPLFQPVDTTAGVLPFDGLTIVAILMVVGGVLILITGPAVVEHHDRRDRN